MRVFNRLLVFAVGIACAGVGFIVVIETIWTGLGYRFLWFPGRQWLRTVETTVYGTRSVEVGAAIAALAGLLLLLAEIRPWRKRLVRVAPADAEGTWLLHRRSLEGLLSRRLQREVPTSPIRVRLRVGAVRWKLAMKARAATSSAPALEEAGKNELDRLGAPSGSKVVVRTTREQAVQ